MRHCGRYINVWCGSLVLLLLIYELWILTWTSKSIGIDVLVTCTLILYFVYVII
jgi:hypothetical protein